MANGLSPENYAFLVRKLIQDANDDGVTIWIRPNFGSGYQLIASRSEDVPTRGIQVDSDGDMICDG